MAGVCLTRGLLLASLLCSASAGATPLPAARLLEADADAGLVSATNAGAIQNVDLGAVSSALPPMIASALQGAPFQYLSGIVVSPYDGKAYIADWGIGSPAIPTIYSLDGATGQVNVVATGAPMVEPYGMTFLPDGRLVVADWDADPSSFGPDASGNAAHGHGALFVIDVENCTPPCIPAVLSDGSIHPFGPVVRTAFEDPVGVVYDSVRNTLYVSDVTAFRAGAASGSGAVTTVYAVNPSSGAVTVVAANPSWTGTSAIDVRSDGKPVVIDTGATAYSVWVIDPASANASTNSTEITGGTQYSVLEDVCIDAADRIFLVDSGDYDSTSGTFIVPPRIWRIDETNADITANAVVVNDNTALITPTAGAVVPVPQATSVVPSVITAATNVIITGNNLNPGVTLDFGVGAAISGVDWAPGIPHGQALQAVVTPTGAVLVPVGCAGTEVDLTLTGPFGGSSVLVNAAAVSGNPGGITPGPPRSRKGDANGDGIVDGLDLALLGMHFGTTYCDGASFYNDADFNDDDVIDGSDLAVLATWFGTSP